ncbi:MAG: hypothetical protein HY711_03555, partial [Candidatus Melainabacteria bacterium]|nr:hypothetical protein [Candidatus Melainabacteria bacterium]
MLVLLLGLVCPQQLLAQTVCDSSQSCLDLTSSDHTITADHHEEFNSATIQLGDTTRSITHSDLLTPAEHVALHQVLSGGEQSIQLDAAGRAVGGTFNLGAELLQYST